MYDMPLPLRIIIGTAVFFIIWAVYDYFALPVYNFTSFGFWVLLGVFSFLLVSITGFAIDGMEGLKNGSKIGVVCGSVFILIALVLSISSLLIWPGNDAAYSGLISPSERNAGAFVSDFPSMDKNTGDRLLLPTIDKGLSIKIAQGKLGEYGAQYAMNEDTFTAITVKRDGNLEVVRISPLDYSGAFVALSGGSKGTVGYIEVNQLTGNAVLVKAGQGMKYTPGAVFSYDLMRHVRFKFRTELLDSVSFEIDDMGRPWWIVPVVKKTIGIFGGENPVGVILIDPVSGDMKKYKSGDQPSWIDRVVPTDIVLKQSNDALKLRKGWFNSVFGDKSGVFQLSDGYNYVFSNSKDNGTTWFVSGITSPNESDQTLAGFMMVNMKTKEARRYSIAGITEMRAMEIAENDERVKAQALTATWPILTDIGGEPAYFTFLKNNVQRQRFVYLDSATGQKVAMGDTIDNAKSEFVRISGSKLSESQPQNDVTGSVFRVRINEKDGTTVFILKDSPGILYTANSDLSTGIRFLEPGDRVNVSYRESSATPGIRFVTKLKNASFGE
jgi:hypothetical protein